MPDYEAGTLDGGFFALADALSLASRTRNDLRIILICDNSDGADVVVAADDVQEIADLRDRRIGTGLGSFGELLVRQMLATAGLAPHDVARGGSSPVHKRLASLRMSWLSDLL
ncbi:MAG: ABC transporter substrate-binding protein [Proteobacteria bacterium]|nr:ABC transporter substrate-binding protein [Pseudomonadota bacterium]